MGRTRFGGSELRRWGLALIGPALLVGAAIALRHLVGEADYETVLAKLLHTPAWRIAAAVALTAASFLALSLYDYNGFAMLGRARPWREIAPGAIAAFAVAQTVGFGPLSGAAVRMRFYLPLGVAPGEIARIVAFVTFSFGLGLAVLGAAGLLAVAPQSAAILGVEPPVLRTAGAALLILVIGFLAVASREVQIPVWGRRRVTLPSRGMLLKQIGVTVLDLALTAGVLWILLPPGAIGFAAFLPIFAVALTLGILSHVPAGLGVFEALVLAALKDAAPASEVIAALALYRLIYFALPIAVAAIAIGATELIRFSRDPATRAVTAAFAGLAPQALAALSLIVGAMLVFSGVTPAAPTDLDRLGRSLPLHLVEASHFLASVLGAVLMIAARGLAFRLDGAWLVALGAAAAAAFLSIAKALALFEAAGLLVFVLLLAASRRRFDRPAAVLNLSLTPPWIAALSAIMLSALVILLFAYDHAEFGIDSWARFEVAAEAPRGLRALVGSALVVGVVGLWSLLRPVPEPVARPTPEDLARAVAIVDRQPGAYANLVRLGDKSVRFSGDGAGFVMYGRRGRSWIALYDPVGPRELWPELVWDFVETARRSGGRAAFYEVSGDNLAIYADAGLRCLKLGEEARVDLAGFSLEGPRRKDQRYVLSRGTREGLALDLLALEAIPAVLDELEAISRAWLKHRGGGEKAFSLGACVRPYLVQQRIAVLRLNGEAIAFATLMETGLKQEAAVDLMRHRQDIPGFAMEFLFLRLIEQLKAEAFRWLSLGMAPLAGLSDREAAPAWHRIGHAVFEHGSRYYNFKGLRGFKAGFQPVWQPRYLAVAGGLNPALVLLDAARLIGGGLQDKPA